MAPFAPTRMRGCDKEVNHRPVNTTTKATNRRSLTMTRIRSHGIVYILERCLHRCIHRCIVHPLLLDITVLGLPPIYSRRTAIVRKRQAPSIHALLSVPHRNPLGLSTSRALLHPCPPNPTRLTPLNCSTSVSEVIPTMASSPAQDGQGTAMGQTADNEMVGRTAGPQAPGIMIKIP